MYVYVYIYIYNMYVCGCICVYAVRLVGLDIPFPVLSLLVEG